MTSGQVAHADFARLRDVGVEVVINLAAPGSSNYNEAEAKLALDNDLFYVHLPVVWSAPKPHEFDTFAAILRAQDGRVVLVHCAKNRRVAAFIYAYRVKFEGEAEAVARARLEQIWQPDEVWSTFLREILGSQST